MDSIMRRGSERRLTSSIFFGPPKGKKNWTEEEDLLLRQLVDQYGTANWTMVAQHFPERTGKQCRERFHNHLDVGIKKGEWSEEEDRIIIILQKYFGNQWAKITKMLPGRTDNAVKNRFHATERARCKSKLDSLYNEDPAYADYIIQEALRVNGESIPACESYSTSHTTFEDDSMDSKSITMDESYGFSTNIPSCINANTMDINLIDVQCDDQPPYGMLEKQKSDNSEMDITSSIFDDNEMHPMGVSTTQSVQDRMEANSVTKLMELDIISIDEEDFLDQKTIQQNQQIPPEQGANCCFSFDWQQKNSNSQPSQQSNYCGLETWNMSHIPRGIGSGNNDNPNTNTQEAPQQHKMLSMANLAALGSNLSYTATTFFCSR